MVKSPQKAYVVLLFALIVVCWYGEYRRFRHNVPSVQSLENVNVRRLKSDDAEVKNDSAEVKSEDAAGFYRPKEAETPEDLNDEQLRKRNVLFGSIIGVLLLSLLIGSIIAVVCKSRRFQCGESVLYEIDRGSVEAQPLLERTPISSPPEVAAAKGGMTAIAEDMRAASEKNQKQKRRSPVSEDSGDYTEAWKKMERKEQEVRVTYDAQQRFWRRLRFWTLIILLIIYIAACLILPRWRRQTASCHKGFFWEMHMMFFSVFCVTKMAELILYTCDPTIEGDLDWIAFSYKFLPSFVSYSDGYLDSTSIQIAASCADECPPAHYLSWTMLISYSVGVVFFQWIILLCFCIKDPSQKSLAKLVHMDALASCIKTVEGYEQTWWWTCMVRTFGEDIPQALQQIVFVVLVQRNHVMYVSITMSLCSGAKAVFDRIAPKVKNGTVYDRLMRLLGSEDDASEENPEEVEAFLKKYPFLRRNTHDLYPWVKEARVAFLKGDKEGQAKGQDILLRMETELEHEGSKLEAAFSMFSKTKDDVMVEGEIKEMLAFLGFPHSDHEVSDLLKIVDSPNRQLTFVQFEVYVGRTGGIYKLFEIRRQELLKKRMSAADDALVHKMDLLEVGLEENEIESWKRSVSKSNFETVANLKPCQKQALRHIRQLARKNHQKAIPELKKRVQNMGFQEEKLWMTLAFIREIAPAIIHIDLDVIAEYLASDTHYRNQFETNSSGGCMSHSLRKTWERNLFGAAYDKAEGRDRVKYGVLNVMNDKKGVLPCSQYGDSYIVLKDVRLRLTCAPEDSSIVDAQRLAVLDYYAHVLNEYTDEELKETITAANSDAEVKGDSKKLGEYKEVQFHGDIELAKHVGEIVIHEKFRGNAAVEKKVEKAAKKNGFEVKWMSDEERRAEHNVQTHKLKSAWSRAEIDNSMDDQSPTDRQLSS